MRKRAKVAMPISKVKAAQAYLDTDPTIDFEFRKWLERNPLKIWKAMNGETEQSLALQINVSQPTINYWLQGRVRPDAPSIIRIAKLIGEHPLELLKRWDMWWAKAPDVAKIRRMNKKKKHALYNTEQGYWFEQNPVAKWLAATGAKHNHTAWRIGVTDNKLYLWMHGQGMPTPEVFVKMADAMGLGKSGWSKIEKEWRDWFLLNPYQRSGQATMRLMNKREKDLYSRTGKTMDDIMQKRERANAAGHRAAVKVRQMASAVAKRRKAD
jgi:transcriptional regulator with XRE-family HTH domain